MSYASVHHSSGSTGHPKPLPSRQRAFLSQMGLYLPPGVIVTPLNHIYPRICLLTGLAYGHPSWPFPHSTPISPRNLLRLLEAGLPSAKAAYVVPSLLAPLLCHSTLLRRFDMIMMAGAPPPPTVAQSLVDQGVHLAQVSGMSECGRMLDSIRDFKHDKNWKYLHPTEFCKDWFDFRDTGEGTYQLFIRAGLPHLHVSNCEDGSLDTKDLWVPHPTRPDLWAYVARTDEIIVHSNGLKTDPYPIENKLTSAVGTVTDAMVVGAERNQPAVLVTLAKPYEEVKGKIWELLEEANADIPTFSRIVPELIVPLDNGEDFVRSTKRSIIRAKSTAKFQDRIDAAYAAYEGKGATGMALTSEADALEVVTSIFERVFPIYASQGNNDRDFFALGMNSITATRVRNGLQSQVKLDQSLDQNVAFSYNTANKLSHHVWNLSRGVQANGDGSMSLAEETQRMLDDALVALWPPAATALQTNGHGTEKRVVLLTGASGGLGAHLLHQLAQSDEPSAILCPVRAKSGEHAVERVETSLTDRGLPSIDQLSQRNTEVYCFPAEFDTEAGIMISYPPRFTRPDVVYHNAWPVNFNYSLSSFAPSISSVVNLISLFPHAHHVIVSSILAAHTHMIDGVVPESIVPQPPEDMRVAYGRSKWIAEKIAEHASSIGVQCSVARIGQITGDTKHGIWTVEEAPPIMVRSVGVLKAMPDRFETGGMLNWIPIDSVAWILEILGRTNATNQNQLSLVNVRAENTMGWSILLEEMRSAGITFDTIPYAVWVERVGEESEKGKSFPAAKLLQYFDDSTTKPPIVDFDIKNLRQTLMQALLNTGASEADASHVLQQKLAGCDRKLVRRMLASWKERGVL